MFFGGDYNPEQWPEDVWREDVELMRRAGVNLVTVGVFSWARLEPARGRYDFGWLDRVLDLLHDDGIRVDLATPTASPPPWFALAHPDALPVTRRRRPAHPRQPRHLLRQRPRVPRGLAPHRRRRSPSRYGDHPALAMWHVHNEYGTACHCDHCADGLPRLAARPARRPRRAQRRVDHGVLEPALHGWEQILPPRATQYRPNPAQVLDFRRFCSDALLAHYREQRDILRAHAGRCR